MIYYELLLTGDNHRRLFSFTIHITKKTWLQLKLNTLQDITNDEYMITDYAQEHEISSYFHNYWLARRKGDSIYLFRPFGGSNNLSLDAVETITDLRHINFHA